MTELTIEQALQQGIAAHKAGKLQEAERFYRAILNVQPQHPDANHNLGVVAVAVGKVEAALPLFKTALEANPGTEQFWFSYIEALIKDNQFELAESILNQVSNKNLDTARLQALRVQLTSARQPDKINLSSQTSNLDAPPEAELKELLSYYQHGKYDEAEKLALTITRRFPNHQFSWGVLGALYLQIGKVSCALSANQKVAELTPHDAAAHYNLGVCLQNLNRLDEAEESYRQALALDPQYFLAHGNLGVTLKGLAKLTEAEISFKQVIRLSPNHAEAYSNLGVALQELDKFEEAEQCFRRAIAIKDHSVLAHYNLGLTLQNLAKSEQAINSYRKVIELEPSYSDAHYNLGNLLQKVDRFDEAVKSYGLAIKHSPGYVDAHFNLGNSLRALGQFEAAVTSYKKATELQVDYVEAYGNLGATEAELGRSVEGRKSSRKAIVLEPKQPLVYFNLGMSVYREKELSLSINLFKRANILEPTFKNNELLLKILTARSSNLTTKKLAKPLLLNSQPYITHLDVQFELIPTLSNMTSRELDTTPDTRFGNGKCSPDYDFFEDEKPIVRAVATDLINIMEEAVGSKVFVYDSFFNIYGPGAGITPHTHLNKLDLEERYGLAKQKFSLVYYLSVGDQNCKEPGFLRFQDPADEVLPDEGMVIIFPASRTHSAVYGGEKDRVMIGANFYSL